MLSEHLAKEHQIEVEHGKEYEEEDGKEGGKEDEEEGGKEGEEEVRSTDSLPRKRGRPRGSSKKGKKLRENSHDDGQDFL